MKYVFYSIAVLVFIGLLTGVYLIARRPIPPASVTTNEITHRNTLPVVTRIIEKNVPADIETLYVDGHNYEVASYSKTIEKDKVKVDLDVRYDERTNMFDVRHNIVSVRDSVYCEKTVETVRYRKPKFIGLTGDIGISTDGKNGYNVLGGDVSLGVKFVGKYSIAPFVSFRNDENPHYGVRLGIDF